MKLISILTESRLKLSASTGRRWCLELSENLVPGIKEAREVRTQQFQMLRSTGKRAYRKQILFNWTSIKIKTEKFIRLLFRNITDEFRVGFLRRKGRTRFVISIFTPIYLFIFMVDRFIISILFSRGELRPFYPGYNFSLSLVDLNKSPISRAPIAIPCYPKYPRKLDSGVGQRHGKSRGKCEEKRREKWISICRVRIRVTVANKFTNKFELSCTIDRSFHPEPCLQPTLLFWLSDLLKFYAVSRRERSDSKVLLTTAGRPDLILRGRKGGSLSISLHRAYSILPRSKVKERNPRDTHGCVSVLIGDEKDLGGIRFGYPIRSLVVT